MRIWFLLRVCFPTNIKSLSSLPLFIRSDLSPNSLQGLALKRPLPIHDEVERCQFESKWAKEKTLQSKVLGQAHRHELKKESEEGQTQTSKLTSLFLVWFCSI
ncbi:unnamed protein product (mitochondrion) [Musa textilis]